MNLPERLRGLPNNPDEALVVVAETLAEVIAGGPFPDISRNRSLGPIFRRAAELCRDVPDPSGSLTELMKECALEGDATWREIRGSPDFSALPGMLADLARESLSRPVYHGSKSRFEAFNLDQAGRLEHASNGALGVWTTPLFRLASSFGGGDGYVYSIAPSEGRILRRPISWLSSMHEKSRRAETEEDAFALYEDFRQEALRAGFCEIWIAEHSGASYNRIILDPDKIIVLEVHEISRSEPAGPGM